MSRRAQAWAVLWLGAALACAPAAAQLLSFTETATGPNRIPLGYPVPLPVESLEPVDGFRSLASLEARLQALALAHGDITEHVIGRSHADRPIHAFVLGDADATTPEGFAESAALVNGGIHAREWASPEVVAALIERFAEAADGDGVHRFVLDVMQLIVVPVLNVDGLLQSQRYPAQTLQTEYPGDPQPAQLSNQPPEYRNYPRDGRMRRKNMRDVDAQLCAAGNPACPRADGMLGVDLNRNHLPFFASGNQNSADPRSLVHHGGAAASEPESQALQAAAMLGPESRLRFYLDTHSFSRLFYGVNTGQPRRDAIAATLAARMSAVANHRYPYEPTPAGVGIGSTDEHFGYRLQIPAYTLEIEPRNGSSEYGGFGYHHDGFILPEREIARVRRELVDMLSLGLYRSAGPPTLLEARIRRSADGALMFGARWIAEGGGRRLAVEARTPLAPDTAYELVLRFDRPMRVRDAGGAVMGWPGQTAPLAPSIAVEGTDAGGAAFTHPLAAPVAGWQAGHYADDSYAVAFTLPATLPLAGARRLNLHVDAQDLSGQALDADPATPVDWSAGWAGYEDDSGRADTDRGGADRSLRIIDDGSPRFGDATPPRSTGGGSAMLLPLLAALLLRRRPRVQPRGTG